MKKIMILGGGYNQLGLIRAAKECKYIVVLCDRNSDCVGRELSDVFYAEDIVDTNKIHQVALRENIDGIISNSEVVMGVVAEVSSRMKLIGNSKECIDVLASKYLFREFQNKIGIFTPKHFLINKLEDVDKIIEQLEFPIVIKPVQCSGTRGTQRFDECDLDKIRESVAACISYSRNSKCAIEEYVEMPSLRVLEGDIFVNKGEILWNGLFFTNRSENLPMVPMTYMSPYVDTKEHMATIKNNIELIVKEMPIVHGQYNVEAYFDNKENFFVIEINARQGGHGLPAFVKLATGIDMDCLLVTTAVGDFEYFDLTKKSSIKQKYATRHAVFSDVSGYYEGVHISQEIQSYVVEIEEEKNVGDYVEKRINGSSVVGFVSLLFESYAKQHYYSENIEQYIYPIVREIQDKNC